LAYDFGKISAGRLVLIGILLRSSGATIEANRFYVSFNFFIKTRFSILSTFLAQLAEPFV